jgi:hypothetical protein
MSENPTWILEVQKFIPENNNFDHVGYMKKFFLTKQEACDYYNKYNPHLRSLNAFGTWVSDYDSANLRYVVRKWNNESLKVEPFVTLYQLMSEN